MTTKDDFSLYVAGRVREEMRKSERSVAWVAKKCGISTERLHRRLHAKVAFTVDELHDVADALGVDTHAFIPTPKRGSAA